MSLMALNLKFQVLIFKEHDKNLLRYETSQAELTIILVVVVKYISYANLENLFIIAIWKRNLQTN